MSRMKRKISEIEYDIYDKTYNRKHNITNYKKNNEKEEYIIEIMNNISIIEDYLNNPKITNNENIIKTKKRYEKYMNNLDNNIIYNIKNELDLFFYLIKTQNTNIEIILKLIIKIDDKLINYIQKIKN